MSKKPWLAADRDKKVARSAEWDILCALPDYLAIPLAGNDTPFDDLDEFTISFRNLRDNFAYEFTRLFVYLVQNRFTRGPQGEAVEKIQQPKLEKFCRLLDTLVNSKVIRSQLPPARARFDHLFLQRDNVNKTEAVLYPRLRSLLEHLGEIKALLALISGHFTPAFDLPLAATIEKDLEVVQDLNTFLESTPHLSSLQTIGASESINQPPFEHLAQTSIRDYAIATFDTVFKYLKVCQTTHTIMLHLSDLADISDAQQEQELSLDLFISACPDHEEWQEARCGPCE